MAYPPTQGSAPGVADGYHWFRLTEDGTTFIALREGRLWYIPGMGKPVDPYRDAVYLRPVEKAPQH